MTPSSHAPSELRQHWRYVVGCFLGLTSGVSSLYFYSSGLFLKPLAAEFGWTRGTASLGSLISSVLLGCAAPFIGQVIDPPLEAAGGPGGVAGARGTQIGHERRRVARQAVEARLRSHGWAARASRSSGWTSSSTWEASGP